MTTVADLRAASRDRVRARIRDLALDAARAITLERGWGAVRMGAVAAEIGTSRQSLHGEFGTKDDLGRELIDRETSLLLAGIAARLDAHPGDLAGAVEAATAYTLTTVAADRLLQAALAGGRSRDGTGHDAALLPLLTSRSEPLLIRGVALLSAWAEEHVPALEPPTAAILVESLVRLVLSHAIAPTSTPTEAARALARLAVAVAGDPTSL